MQEKFNLVLKELHYNSLDRGKRYILIFELLYIAIYLGYEAGITQDNENSDVLIAIFELPDVGQITYHFPKSKLCWDGADNKERYKRINKFLREVENNVI